MFTGIVSEQGTVRDVQPLRENKVFSIALRKHKLAASESVAVNGVCLTVVGRRGTVHAMAAMPETLNLTNLRQLAKGDRVNIELPLRYGEHLGGHFVLGHVDDTAKVLVIQRNRNGTTARVRVAKKFQKFVARKGSVALDGVSLTIARAGSGWLEVALIPYTLKHTTLGKRKKGDLLNIEFDIFARYAARR